MSLLDTAKKEAGVPVTPATSEGTSKKKSNSEYQKKQRELAAKYGKQLKEYFGDKVPEQIKDAVAFFAKEKKAAAGAAFGKPVLYKLFGNTPKVGDKVTALKVFEDTGKGFAEMRSLMKKWADKQNIIVEYDDKTKSYVIKSGEIPAFAE